MTRKMADTVIATVPSGADLIPALNELSGGGWIQAVGRLTGARVRVAPSAGAQPVDGLCALVSLSGPAGGPFMVTLASEPDGAGVGGALTGGELVRAQSAGVHVLVLGAAHDDRRPAEEASGRGGGVAGAAPASEQEESDVLPAFGDHVEHPVFGRCEVMVVRDDRLKIRDVGGEKRLREIHLRVFRVLPPVDQDGTKVFRLVKR